MRGPRACDAYAFPAVTTGEIGIGPEPVRGRGRGRSAFAALSAAAIDGSISGTVYDAAGRLRGCVVS